MANCLERSYPQIRIDESYLIHFVSDWLSKWQFYFFLFWTNGPYSQQTASLWPSKWNYQPPLSTRCHLSIQCQSYFFVNQFKTSSSISRRQLFPCAKRLLPNSFPCLSLCWGRQRWLGCNKNHRPPSPIINIFPGGAFQILCITIQMFHSQGRSNLESSVSRVFRFVGCQFQSRSPLVEPSILRVLGSGSKAAGPKTKTKKEEMTDEEDSQQQICWKVTKNLA